MYSVHYTRLMVSYGLPQKPNPCIGEDLDMKPAAIYERQRALVRAGLIDMQPGHGPGSGVRATPQAVALLLIAILATDNLTETEQSARLFAKLKSNEEVCPLTGEKTFASALAAVLSSKARAVVLVRVQRSHGYAGIWFQRRGRTQARGSIFSTPEPREAPIQTSTEIYGSTLRQIGKELEAVI